MNSAWLAAPTSEMYTMVASSDLYRGWPWASQMMSSERIMAEATRKPRRGIQAHDKPSPQNLVRKFGMRAMMGLAAAPGYGQWFCCSISEAVASKCFLLSRQESCARYKPPRFKSSAARLWQPIESARVPASKLQRMPLLLKPSLTAVCWKLSALGACWAGVSAASLAALDRAYQSGRPAARIVRNRVVGRAGLGRRQQLPLRSPHAIWAGGPETGRHTRSSHAGLYMHALQKQGRKLCTVRPMAACTCRLASSFLMDMQLAKRYVRVHICTCIIRPSRQLFWLRKCNARAPQSYMPTPLV